MNSTMLEIYERRTKLGGGNPTRCRAPHFSRTWREVGLLISIATRHSKTNIASVPHGYNDDLRISGANDNPLRKFSRIEAHHSANLLKNTPMVTMTTIKRPLLWGALATFLLPVVACSCPSTPSVASLAPSTAAAGGADFTLTVNGHHFDSNAVVVWNGTPLTTSFVSNAQLTASVPSSDITNPGPAEVFVYNPANSGGAVNAGTIEATDNTGCGAAGSNETPFTVSP
jgi:hypothetical protein